MVKKISFIILFTTAFTVTMLGSAAAESISKNQIRSSTWPEAMIFTKKEMTNLEIVDRSYAEKIKGIKGVESKTPRFNRWLKIIEDSNRTK